MQCCSADCSSHMAAGDGSSELEDDNTQSSIQDAPDSDPFVTSTQETETKDENEHDQHGDEEDAEEVDEEDEDDEEPRLKYATLTKNLSSLYRNGDATSSCLVVGDKMACPIFLYLWIVLTNCN